MFLFIVFKILFLFSFLLLQPNFSTIHFCLRDEKSQGTKIMYYFVNKSKFKDKNSINCVNNISNNEFRDINSDTRIQRQWSDTYMQF